MWRNRARATSELLEGMWNAHFKCPRVGNKSRAIPRTSGEMTEGIGALRSSPHGCGHRYDIRVKRVSGDVNAVSDRKESIEPLDEKRITME